MNRLLLLFLIASILTGCGENRESQLAKARASIEAGETEAGQTIYLQLLETQPANPDAIQGMIDATRITSATAEHQRWCRELIRYRPWNRHANIVTGKQLMADGNLQDAVVRFFMAYQESDFAQDRREIVQLLEQVRELERQRPERKKSGE